jgi:hypothetical protein
MADSCRPVTLNAVAGGTGTRLTMWTPCVTATVSSVIAFAGPGAEWQLPLYGPSISIGSSRSFVVISTVAIRPMHGKIALQAVHASPRAFTTDAHD